MTIPVKKILAIDTALMGCAVAVWDVTDDSGHKLVEPMARGQSERLVPMAQEVMAIAGCGFPDLDLIAVTVGPGAFTGLRLGLSAARAWGLSLRRPVAGVDTLSVLAAMFYGGTAGPPARVLIETKRNDFYTQLFDESGAAAGPAESIPFAAIRERGDPPGTVYVGDAAQRFAALCPPGDDVIVRTGFELIDPVALARLAHDRFIAGLTGQSMPEPLYLRGADVSQSKRIQRHIAE